MIPRFIFPLLLVSMCACGKDPLADAKKLERLGRYPSAIEAYEAHLSKKSQNSAEAAFRVAEIYRTVIRDYGRARLGYDSIAKNYSKTPWAGKAYTALINCPDYFPLNPEFVRRTGDSQSGGEYMQTEEEMQELSDPKGRFKVKRKIFAGQDLVSSYEKIYEKKDGRLEEFPLGAGAQSVILQYPIEKNRNWETVREGKKIFFRIESDDATVSIKAGKFDHCLKLRIQNSEDEKTWKVEYYAPDVGFILATVETDNGETRVSELISYLNKKSALNQPPLETAPSLWKKWTSRLKKKEKKGTDL